VWTGGFDGRSEMTDREWLKQEMDAEITDRKIRKIAFIHNGKVLTAEVEVPSPHNGVVVRAIYEDGKRGIFLICAGDVSLAPKASLVEEK
jgi:hypothetical protein